MSSFVRSCVSIMAGVVWLTSIVLPAAAQEKSANTYINAVKDRCATMKNTVMPKVDFMGPKAQEDMDFVQKDFEKSFDILNKVAAKFNPAPKSYEAISIEKTRAECEAAKQAFVAKYEADQKRKQELGAMTGKDMTPQQIAEEAGAIYDLYVKSELSKARPATPEDYAKIRVEIQKRLDQYETSKKFILRLAESPKWKDAMEVKQLYHGFKDPNPKAPPNLMDYRLNLNKLVERFDHEVDLTLHPDWKGDLAQSQKSLDQMKEDKNFNMLAWLDRIQRKVEGLEKFKAWAGADNPKYQEAAAAYGALHEKLQGGKKEMIAKARFPKGVSSSKAEQAVKSTLGEWKQQPLRWVVYREIADNATWEWRSDHWARNQWQEFKVAAAFEEGGTVQVKLVTYKFFEQTPSDVPIKKWISYVDNSYSSYEILKENVMK
nr:hypothetical protein [Nitrospirota bacterium]